MRKKENNEKYKGNTHIIQHLHHIYIDLQCVLSVVWGRSNIHNTWDCVLGIIRFDSLFCSGAAEKRQISNWSSYLAKSYDDVFCYIETVPCRWSHVPCWSVRDPNGSRLAGHFKCPTGFYNNELTLPHDVISSRGVAGIKRCVRKIPQISINACPSEFIKLCIKTWFHFHR